MRRTPKRALPTKNERCIEMLVQAARGDEKASRSPPRFAVAAGA
jgi:hypothetical protein